MAHQQKGIISTVLQGVFALGVAAFILVLLVPRVALPSAQLYTNEQANFVAQSVAFSINTLSVSEKGGIKRTFESPWNIEISVKDNVFWVKASHDNIEGNPTKTLGSVKDVTESSPKVLSGVTSITITKDPGQDVVVK